MDNRRRDSDPLPRFRLPDEKELDVSEAVATTLRPAFSLDRARSRKRGTSAPRRLAPPLDPTELVATTLRPAFALPSAEPPRGARVVDRAREPMAMRVVESSRAVEVADDELEDDLELELLEPEACYDDDELAIDVDLDDLAGEADRRAAGGGASEIAATRLRPRFVLAPAAPPAAPPAAVARPAPKSPPHRSRAVRALRAMTALVALASVGAAVLVTLPVDDREAVHRAARELVARAAAGLDEALGRAADATR